MAIPVPCAPDAERTDALLAEPSGSLDVAGAARLWEVVSERLDAETPSLLVDLSAVPLVTSAGVGTLVRLLHRVRNLGGSMAVFAASTRIREVLDAVMLTEILRLSQDLEEARARLGG